MGLIPKEHSGISQYHTSLWNCIYWKEKEKTF